MDVSCPACAAKYTADEEKLRGKTARMRCKACNTAWLVTGPGASGAPPSAGPVSMIPGSMPPASMAPASMPPSGAPAASVPPISMPKNPVPLEFPKAAAAVVKKGGERERRDLFAERPLDEGSVREGSVNGVNPSQTKDTVLPPPSFGFNGGTGQRNENSVLFRVDQLAATGRIKTPEPMQPVHISSMAPTAMRGDDEGMIDLKALSSPSARAVVPVAPLFSEPPPMTMEVGRTGSQPAVAKPINKLHLIGAIAAAAVFLLVAGLGISIVFKGEDAVARTAPAAVAPPPVPTVAATTAPTADPAASSSATASNDDSDSPKKGKKGKRKLSSKGQASSSSIPKAPKAADPCGCKGDFNCVLACTAKNGH